MALCLRIFQAISGLKVNFSKSSMVDINVEDRILSSYVEAMRCSVGSWPMSYLGMPLCGNPRAVCFWDPMVERISKKLA